jgi:hypothetical protein
MTEAALAKATAMVVGVMLALCEHAATAQQPTAPRPMAQPPAATGATPQRPTPKPPAAQPPIAITNVTVVDVATGTLDAARTVVTQAGRITAVGPAASVSIPAGAERVDGTGKFLIPGLWDMHAHHEANGAEFLDMYLAHGVVGTRDMGSAVDVVLPLRDRINRGELQGPEIIAAGPILDDRPPDWPFRQHITNAQEARQAVRDLKARGVDFIKVHDGTPRDAFFAIAEETSKLGLPFAGHVPMNVSVDEAIDAGIRSIEHLSNGRIFFDCSGGNGYDAAGCRSRFAALAAKGVWQTPTIGFFLAIPDAFTGKPLAHAEYVSDRMREMVRKNAESSKASARDLARIRSLGQWSLSAIRDLASSGNRLLAGCDGIVPGFCLHDELELFTTAGLSPLQALQTATINPARFLGREQAQGTIDAGKRADLILLDANPLQDIRHTRRIAAVLVRGRLLAKPAIDRIIADRRRPPSQP